MRPLMLVGGAISARDIHIKALPAPNAYANSAGQVKDAICQEECIDLFHLVAGRM